MKVFLFFLMAFAAVIVPVVGALLVGFLGPPPYVLRGTPREGEQKFADGSVVRLHRAADAKAARAEAARLARAIPASPRTRLLHETRYRRSDDGRHGLIVPVEDLVVQVEAPDKKTVAERFAALDVVAPNPRKNPVWLAFTRYAWILAAGFVLYLIFYGWLLTRGGSWAATVEPQAPRPVAAEVLRERLLAINALEVPFAVREGEKGRLLAEWRVADARWAGPLEAGGLNMVHRLHLELDEAGHQVRVLDTQHTLEWSGGVGHLAGSARFFRGITFAQYDRAAAHGLLYDEDGRWALREAYDYRFELREMKNPLIEAVTESGWRWKPVVSFVRVVGG